MKLEKIVVAPDSFKGTMSAYEVCLAVRQAIDIAAPGASVSLLPVADGGEGSVDCLISAVGGEKRNISVNGPFFEPVEGFYAVLDDGTAVVEAAACDGLVLAGERKSAADATSCGIGETILAAIKSGCKRVLLCIGGTASNDGGCGMAAALGVKFYRGGEEFVPVGRTLCDIDRIDVSKAKAVVGDVKIDVLCDVDNPFYGKDGAAFVFAPQKGVKEGETEMLDDGMRHLAEIILRDVGADVSSLRGAGAAGGIGGSTYSAPAQSLLFFRASCISNRSVSFPALFSIKPNAAPAAPAPTTSTSVLIISRPFLSQTEKRPPNYCEASFDVIHSGFLRTVSPPI